MDGWTLDRFHQLVAHMRVAQKRYFARRRSAPEHEYRRALEESIELERRVDAAIDEIARRMPLFDGKGPGSSEFGTDDL